ncbi:hypothetical protein BKA65DRAFT_14944 [Rhexocercosporidium sp. MPI-PUGE-AT-0058]|nr:hypothetical protein BKA65DRAFT_14944 [Rhexocercosporidium sp. MPI-PUGE-AT-0058]
MLNTSVPMPLASSLKRKDLLVEVSSAAINPVDYKLPETGMGAFMISKLATRGLVFCGRVKVKHISDDSIEEGQLVFGCVEVLNKHGSCGQFLIAERSECAVLPDGMDVDQTVAFGTAGMTAYQSLLP